MHIEQFTIERKNANR